MTGARSGLREVEHGRSSGGVNFIADPAEEDRRCDEERAWTTDIGREARKLDLDPSFTRSRPSSLDVDPSDASGGQASDGREPGWAGQDVPSHTLDQTLTKG